MRGILLGLSAALMATAAMADEVAGQQVQELVDLGEAPQDAREHAVLGLRRLEEEQVIVERLGRGGRSHVLDLAPRLVHQHASQPYE